MATKSSDFRMFFNEATPKREVPAKFKTHPIFKNPPPFRLDETITSTLMSLCHEPDFTSAELDRLLIEIFKSRKKLNSKQLLFIMMFDNGNNKIRNLKFCHQMTFNTLFTSDKHPFQTKSFHYDWWMFPMYVPREWKWPERNYKCSCTDSDVQLLLADKQYFEEYCNCIELYINALSEKGWNDWPVRLARLMTSLDLFINNTDSLSQINKLTELANLVVEYIESQRDIFYKSSPGGRACFKDFYRDYKLFNDSYTQLKTLIDSHRPETELGVHEESVRVFAL